LEERIIKMGLFNYHIKIACDNCGFKNKLSVKKGIAVKEFIGSSKCKCSNCGVGVKPKEYSTEYIK
jgi:predicted RNA-binding Zn-ribbon protein involved in translation (DUF1610 family)|tara:strand:+ start:330 stop:527 length:198 start_codon:yes stop_codon:yes gene_type:complete